MKLDLYNELKNKLFEYKAIIYEKALSYSNGDIELASQKIAHAVEQVAKSYLSMLNKDKIMDMVFQKLSESPKKYYKLSATETADIIDEILTYIQKKKKLVYIFTGVGAVVAVSFVVFIVITQMIRVRHSDADVLIMKDTKWIDGDIGTVSLVNYHNVSENLGKKAVYDSKTDYPSFLNRMASSIIAPNGQTYIVYQNMEKEDGSNVTFSLYQMTEIGWLELGKGEVEGKQKLYAERPDYCSFSSSFLYLVADQDSNIYVFAILNEKIVVYRYEILSGIFKKLEAEYDSPNLSSFDFSIYYDEQYGSKGTVYIGICNSFNAEFVYYDIETAKFMKYGKVLNTSLPYLSMRFCVENHEIHVAAQGGIDRSILKYYHIQDNNELIINEIELFCSRGEPGFNDNEEVTKVNIGGGDIICTQEGIVYIIATHSEFDKNLADYLVLYTIQTDTGMERHVLAPQFFEGSEYSPLCRGVFTDGFNVYYIETYNNVFNFFSIVKIDSEGALLYVDSIEMPDNIIGYGLRLNGNSAVFHTGEDLYYFQLLMLSS